jgi:hypothetical protein
MYILYLEIIPYWFTELVLILFSVLSASCAHSFLLYSAITNIPTMETSNTYVLPCLTGSSSMQVSRIWSNRSKGYLSIVLLKYYKILSSHSQSSCFLTGWSIKYMLSFWTFASLKDKNGLSVCFNLHFFYYQWN